MMRIYGFHADLRITDIRDQRYLRDICIIRILCMLAVGQKFPPLSQLMERISRLTAFRTERISLAQEKLPPPLMLLVIVMTAIIIISSLLTAVKDHFINHFIVTSTTFSAWLIYYIIVDLDNPFVGFWNVRDDSFRAFSEKLERLLGRQ